MKTLTLLLFAFLALNQAAVVPEGQDGHLENAGDPQVMTVQSCSWGWSLFNGRCYRYFSTYTTWAQAEKNCLGVQANLASIHSYEEYQFIHRLILDSTSSNVETWIGGTNAQQSSVWLWSDGSNFLDANWCSGQPYSGHRCVTINFDATGCWRTYHCTNTRPYVCVKRD
ncbi:ladderlectin-like isoform X2 [Poeciliopsis prolifica]|uniref:ladderlectin-like isoform X2 n=1 Tax=Poeciliopsis prolifica TaxID=188132 RepID=UPI0024136714|nr:ladderlectin-like isoform X2 [Poeciliopsis prolifica]